MLTKLAPARRSARSYQRATNARFRQFGLSEAVLAEARRGDPAAVSQRIAVADGIEILNATQEAEALATALLRAAALPAKAAIDAAHVALATVHGIDYLLTWNRTHIANAVTRPLIEAVCRGSGFQPPVICTPEELVDQEAT